jgi:hypothetical protein
MYAWDRLSRPIAAGGGSGSMRYVVIRSRLARQTAAFAWK